MTREALFQAYGQRTPGFVKIVVAFYESDWCRQKPDFLDEDQHSKTLFN